jgi:alginate O-acetyltransferase complex protein AlgI
MLFNSVEFFIFLPIVYLLYWYGTGRNIKVQNALLLIASYFFYGWWDWRFLLLIAFSSGVDYSIGILLSKQSIPKKRKMLLALSILVNIGLLGFFKYSNFFISNFIGAFTFFGSTPSINTLNIILPVGISFYTFQTLSYTIDVYNKKLEPTNDALAFFSFVSFFPQLVAGPIERATNLLPQFQNKRTQDLTKSMDGLRQILWGLFKKVVLADNCAIYVNDIFGNFSDQSGSTLALGAILFSFQIYGDFSGYSDIAIGTARLFGFNLMRNFAFPYFSRDIAEFWRRWHISLSTWFRDYLYIPIGGSKENIIVKIRNIFIIFLVSGFWHGANWTFIFWGLLHALFFLPLLIYDKNRTHLENIAEGSLFPSIKEMAQITITFSMVSLAWVFFRAENLSVAFSYLSGIFSFSFFSVPNIFPFGVVLIILVVVLTEWFQRSEQHGLQFLGNKNIPEFFRWSFFYFLTYLIVAFKDNQQDFIYFQF